MSEPTAVQLENFQDKLNYHFKDIRLLHTALTHSTWAYESAEEDVEENERMEFLGDSVLGLIISTHLYNDQKELAEGRLSRIRAQIVREETLYEVAKDIGLGDLIKLGVGEERTGGRDKPSNLSDCLEALLGAVYLDSDFETCFKLVSRLFKKHYN